MRGKNVYVYNKDSDTAIKQIKEKRYHGVHEGYTGRGLLVGISYEAEGEDKKKHSCEIEEIRILYINKGDISK